MCSKYFNIEEGINHHCDVVFIAEVTRVRFTPAASTPAAIGWLAPVWNASSTSGRYVVDIEIIDTVYTG
jgi:hypothetical protein